MKKKITVLIITVLIILACASVLAACNKTEQEEILPATEITVSDASGLDGIRNYTGSRYKNYTFKLKNDIDLSGYERWASIGANVNDAFQGTLDGDGHKITNLNVKGWDQDGNPLFVGKGEQIEGVTAYSSVALFGYTHSATLKNIALDVNIYYYMDIDYGYAAGLIGYNTGASTIENVTVSGNIAVSNIFQSKRKYTDTGEYKTITSECSTTGYIGGVMAYSVGNTTLKNVKSTVNIDNSNYYAYYADENAVAPEVAEEEDFTPAYCVIQTVNTDYKPRQIFAGGIVSFMKSSEGTADKTAKITGSSYSGNINISAKSATTSGIVAAAYSVDVDDCTVDAVGIVSEAKYKNVSGGIVAMVDGGVTEDNASTNVNISLKKLGGTVESVSVGGIFGYACNLAVIKNSDVSDLLVTVDLDKSAVGGVGGVIRDSSVTDCSSLNARMYMTAAGTNQESLNVFAVTVSSIYGNSVLKDCEGSATNFIVSSSTTAYANENGYSTRIDTTYVEDNGKPAVRLYKKGSTKEYLTAYAKVENGKLKVTLMDEELTVLSEAVYALDAPETDLFNPAETYLDAFFGADGFKTAESGQLKADGRDVKNYEWRSGKSVVENIEVKRIED